MWGIYTVINNLRRVFVHQVLPEDAKAEHILWWVDQIIEPYEKNHMDGVKAPVFKPSTVQFLGPDMKNDGWKANRVTIYYDINRRITDIAVG